jgi:glycosyltransferase involved in cell wall biosynthesis
MNGLVENNPLVSILINNYNYGRFLGEAIESALSQTYRPVEIIVVDDGSTDNSRKIIAQYGNRIIPILKENGGQASAFNAGFAASRGEIICFLDADDEYLPGKISEVTRIFNKFPESDWFFHQYKQVNLINNITVEPVPSCIEEEKDARSSIFKGKVPFTTTGILGECFRRPFLAQILPMPEGPGITISDEYIKELAMGLGKGYYSNQLLAIQKLHENNLFTGRKNRLMTQINILIQTAYWIRKDHPEFIQRTDRMFAMANLFSFQGGGSKYESRAIADEYWASSPFAEKLKIKILFLYYLLKYWNRSKINNR